MNTSNGTRFDLQQFEKNRYFKGKLVTDHDMLVEQQYHANRLETVTRLSAGSGILRGLTVSEFDHDGEQLHLKLDPGVAIDPAGRPIVVSTPMRKSLPAPDGDEIYLYIEHTEETKDPVPVPGKEALDEDGSEESRVLEAYTVSAKETSPALGKRTAEVEFPDVTDTDRTFQELADEIASVYHDSRRASLPNAADGAVFLGSFKRFHEDEWRRGSETAHRSFVYDNDMLFSLVLSHVADTDNPHDTRDGFEGDTDEFVGQSIDELGATVQTMRSELDKLRESVDRHTEYATYKSLKTMFRFFDDLADAFETESEISRRSLDIVETVRLGIDDGVHHSRHEYVAFVERVLEELRALDGALSGRVTERSRDRYRNAMDTLAAVTTDEASVVDVATALDRVGETTELLEKQHQVVPEGGE